MYIKILIGYFGGEDKLLAETSSLTITFQTPPCCCCLRCIRGSPITRLAYSTLKIWFSISEIIRFFSFQIIEELYCQNADKTGGGFFMQAMYNLVKRINNLLFSTITSCVVIACL